MDAGDTVTAFARTASPDAAQGASRNGPWRILLAERRASAQSELSRRLTRLGHEVMARVTSGQGAMDYASFLSPDVVLLSPILEDMSGVTAALTITRTRPGVAAVLLSSHPAAADPSARPNWGAVAVVPTDAEPDDLHAAIAQAVARARAANGGMSAAAADEPPADSRGETAPTMTDDGPTASETSHVIGSEEEDGGALVIIGARDSESLVTAIDDAAEEERELGESDLVARAIDALGERSGLSADQARRLMQDEAEDRGETLADVARAMLDDDMDSGSELGAAA